MRPLQLILCLVAFVVFSVAQTSASETRTNEFKLPASADLRPNFERWKLPLKKQGARPTCSVFATVAAMEYASSRQADRGVELSQEFANWAGNRAINHDQDGHFFSEIIKGYEELGICRIEDMPYATNFDAARQPSEQARNHANEMKSLGLKFHWLRPNDGTSGIDDTTVTQMKSVLARGWPVAMGSYHSILIVGFSDDAKLDGGGEFLLRDSGGGNEQTISYAAAKKRICDAFWVEAPLRSTNSASF